MVIVIITGNSTDVGKDVLNRLSQMGYKRLRYFIVGDDADNDDISDVYTKIDDSIYNMFKDSGILAVTLDEHDTKLGVELPIGTRHYAVLIPEVSMINKLEEKYENDILTVYIDGKFMDSKPDLDGCGDIDIYISNTKDIKYILYRILSYIKENRLE